MKRKGIVAISCILVLCLLIYLVSANNSRLSRSDLVSGGDSTHSWRAYGTVAAESSADNTITVQIDPDKCYKLPYDQVILDCSQQRETFASSVNSTIKTGDDIVFDYFISDIKENHVTVRYVAARSEGSGNVVSRDPANKILTVQIGSDSAGPLTGHQVSLHCTRTDLDLDTVDTGDSVSFYYYEDESENNKDIFPEGIDVIE